jgi:hypothetical protein
MHHHIPLSGCPVSNYGWLCWLTSTPYLDWAAIHVSDIISSGLRNCWLNWNAIFCTMVSLQLMWVLWRVHVMAPVWGSACLWRVRKHTSNKGKWFSFRVQWARSFHYEFLEHAEVIRPARLDFRYHFKFSVGLYYDTYSTQIPRLRNCW